MIKRILVLVVVVMLGGCSSQERVVRYRPGSVTGRWDDADWRRVLKGVVTADGMVRYGRLTGNVGGVRDALDRYVGQIAANAPWNRPELFPNETDRLACYLNAHNALAMDLALRKGLPANVALAGVFTTPVTFGGHEVILEDLLNNYIRTSGDPRVYFAVCTMSRSSPPLRSEPYSGERIDEQLADQARRCLSDGRLVKKADSSTVALSELLTRFYAQDFKNALTRATGAANPSLIDSLSPLAGPDSALAGARVYQTMGFDWRVNSE